MNRWVCEGGLSACDVSQQHTPDTHIIQLLQVKHHPVGHSSPPEPNVCLLLSASLLSWNIILLHALEQVKTHTCTRAHTHQLYISIFFIPCSFIILQMWEKKHTQKRGAILVCPSLRRRSKQNDFYVFLKKTHKTPFLWPQKTVIIISIDRFQNMAMKKEIKKNKNNDSQIYFLCIGWDPQHWAGIFYAWVTARKQSLLVLSMHSAQRRGNRSEWVETDKQDSGWVWKISPSNFRSWKQQWLDWSNMHYIVFFIDCDAAAT